MHKQAAVMLSAFALTATTLAVAPAPTAQERLLAVRGDLDIPRNIQTLHMASRLRALSQTMTIHALLIALAPEPGPSLRTLAEQNENFSRIIAGLRQGDPALGLEMMSNPRILERLARLEREWSVFGPVVQRILDRGEVTPEDVALVAQRIGPQASATRELIDEVQYQATGGQTFSLRTKMIGRTEEQQALIQEIVAGTLLIAYGHQPEAYRAKLLEQQSRFDRTLKGLLHGDSSLQLLPAPTLLLRERFRTALSLWGRMSPVLTQVAEGAPVPEKDIPALLKTSHELAAELRQAVELYRII